MKGKRISLISGVFGLFVVFCACSKDEPRAGVTSGDEGDVEYETVTLSMGSDMQDTAEDAARLGYYETMEGRLPVAKLRFGVDGATHKVYTVVYSINNKTLYKGYLDWTITRNGTRLEYNGPLRIQKIRNSTANPNVDDRLRLVAIPANRGINIATSVYAEFRQDTRLTEVPAGGTATHNTVPYVMTTMVKRKGPHGADSRTLVNADPETSKFKPQGNLVRFRVTNSTNENIKIHGVGISPYHVPEMGISTNTGVMSLTYIYESNGPQMYIELNPSVAVTLQPGQTSNTLQYWTPIQHPNNEGGGSPTTETAPEAPLFVYIFKVSDPGTRYLRTEKLSRRTTNAERNGKQLYYNVNVTELKNKF